MGKVSPLALERIEKNHLSTDGLRSKDWSRFLSTGRSVLHFVFTVWTKRGRRRAQSGQADR